MPLVNLDKRGGKCGFYRFYMLGGVIHVCVKRKCVLFAQEESNMYFGVMCPFFIGIYIILSFTYLLSTIVFHIVRITCLLNAFRKTSMEPIKTVNSSLCYDFLELIFLDYASLFQYGFILCNLLIIVLSLLLYLRFCHGLTKGEIVRFMCFG